MTGGSKVTCYNSAVFCAYKIVIRNHPANVAQGLQQAAPKIQPQSKKTLHKEDR